jgi:hypothetical protein
MSSLDMNHVNRQDQRCHAPGGQVKGQMLGTARLCGTLPRFLTLGGLLATPHTESRPRHAIMFVLDHGPSLLPFSL